MRLSELTLPKLWVSPLLLLTAMVLLLVQFFYFHDGYLGTDDLEYCRQAGTVVQGRYAIDSTNLYSFRWTVIFALAFLYRLFGINDFSNMLVTLIPFLAILGLVLAMLKEYSTMAKIVATLFIIFLPTHSLYFVKPMPDIWVELGVVLCFFGYFQVKFSSNVTPKRWGLFFVLGFILLFLAKESFLVFYPFFLFLFFRDTLKKEHKTFWRWAALGIVGFLLVYIGYFVLIIQNPTARVDAIFYKRFISICSYDFQPLSVLLDRISYTLWRDFIRSNVFVSIGFLFFLSQKQLLSTSEKFVFRSAIALLLLANFMSITYTAYVPLCDDTRHFLYILPFMAYIFGVGIDRMPKSNHWGFVLLGGTIILQAAYMLQYDATKYLMLFIPLFLGFFCFKYLKFNVLGCLLIVIGLSSQFVISLKYYKSLNYPEQKALLKVIKKDSASRIRIVTDPVYEVICDFHLGYDTTRIKITKLNDFDIVMQKDTTTKTFLVLNGYTAYIAKMGWEKLPSFAQTAYLKLPVVLSNKGGVVYLWKADD